MLLGLHIRHVQPDLLCKEAKKVGILFWGTGF